MKNTILLFCLLVVSSCGVFKNKNKEKTKENLEVKVNIESNDEIFATKKLYIAKKDSTWINKNDSSTYRKYSVNQNFTLKNNGKCLDGGLIRFVNFTDNKGNKTEIPVNDNTDLDFSNANEITEENKLLKTEILKISTENLHLQDSIRSLKKIHSKSSAKSENLNLKTNIETKKNTWASYVLVAFATLVFWEFGKKYLKFI